MTIADVSGRHGAPEARAVERRLPAVSGRRVAGTVLMSDLLTAPAATPSGGKYGSNQWA